jgi:colanic acid biosynthesis glycosyl transferase WcaI
MLTNGLSTLFTGLAKVKSTDEVLTISAPPSLPFLAAITAKLKGAPYSVIIHDKYPEQLVALNKLRPDSMLVKIFNRFNRWLYSNARNIIAIGRDMEELVAAQTQPRAGTVNNVVTIANWAALEEVEPRPKEENELLKKLGISDKFVFLYAGNKSHPQDVESIIECARRLKDHEKIRFVFIGGGIKRKLIESEIRDNQLRNVYLLDPLPREQQTLFLNACDVGLVSLVRNMYGLAVPSRTYNFLAAGKPILALTEKNSEVERVILEENAGWTVEPQNPDELEKVIETIYSRRDELKEIGAAARRAAVEKYDAESSVEKYRRVMHVGDGGAR